jgi:predicted dehydrogenase
MNSTIRVGMAGLGMIFEETYLPVFNKLANSHLTDPSIQPASVRLAGTLSRTGRRVEKFKSQAAFANCSNYSSLDSIEAFLSACDAVCIATPDNRHFPLAKMALESGKHVLIEKPSVLSLDELDQLCELAKSNDVLCRVVYHKLADPDHKKLRTHVIDGVLRHVNSGYCTLLEPKQISLGQFSEWIGGRNPGTYVAVHYIKLIDFTFGHSSGNNWRLSRVSCTGQRGIVGPQIGNTWDSVQLRIEYVYPDGREACFDIHTNWVNPDNFCGYVEQEAQFRFDNAVWLSHQRKRGVELSVENKTPHEIKETPNHHYNADIVEPWNFRHRRGYGLEVIERFFVECASVHQARDQTARTLALNTVRKMEYASIEAERNVVAVVQAMESILSSHANGRPGGIVTANNPAGGLLLWLPGESQSRVLYPGKI